ncbi:hypothetical protein SUGI_0470980 [Cryptomeria japonica]|uniref:cleavage stimulating factor 64 n=1 Tax=Cryptomeria japonica TaxID=3369 RepID=UPI002408E9EA|nr:cleavage stimulating factor 64 [Cryptomeria japonica]GLJ24628.1 hypothetical protein SUGI_0470980 [Cryptomeria japonica]
MQKQAKRKRVSWIVICVRSRKRQEESIMSIPHNRCVFVGNIPYDATEEQLIEICKEVGPVVSFRLVVDRETGKPKGYGFCEYRDEETAASARRNLQGYEVNGRQLRVDYAENAKGVDRNREQDRGGPGLASNFDSQKQPAGAGNSIDPSINRPIGITVAANAATIMAGSLGEPQTATMSTGQTNAGGHDPLTLHLANMSKSQLHEVLYEMKALAQQNQQQARQILVAYPQFAKAVFQMEIMLGMVPSQMLASFRQSSNLSSQQTIQTGQPDSVIQSGLQGQAHLHSVHNQILPGQQTQMQIGQNGQAQLLQQAQAQNMPIQLIQTPLVQPPIQVHQQSQSQVSQSISQSIQTLSQGLHLPVQPTMQSPQNAVIQSQVAPVILGQSQQSTMGNLHQPPLPQQPRPSLQSHQSSGQMQSQPTQNMAYKQSSALHQQPSRPLFQPGNYSQSTPGISFQKHNQPLLPNLRPPQHSYQIGSGTAVATVSHAGPDLVGQITGNSNVQTSVGLLSVGVGGKVQGGGASAVQYLNTMDHDVSRAQVPLPTGVSHHSEVSLRMNEPGGRFGDSTTGLTASTAPTDIEDGSNRVYGAVSGGMITGSLDSGVGASSAYSQGPAQLPVEGIPEPQQSVSQTAQLTPEVESELLQQVMKLTPEQINSLPPDQQQQVIQLQQMFRSQ